MKMNFSHFGLVAFLVLFTGFSFSSNAQFSIRKNSSNSSAVDILYTAPAVGQGVHPVQFFEFALQVPNPQGATLTASFAPGAPLAALGPMQAYTGTDYGNATFAWASTGVPNYANTFNFPATEVILGTVSFSSAANAQGAIVSAIDYQDQATYGGPGTGVAVWTMQVDPSGTEVTNYAGLFYQSAASGSMPGSAAPTTTSDGGVSNQKVSLTSTPLPVTLKDFGASASGCNVLLSWETGAERDFDRFDVQYSSDGSSYITIGSVKSKGSTTGSTYTYSTTQPTGMGMYRLSMADKDGSYTVSKVVNIRTQCSDNTTTWTVYPNPAEAGGGVYLQADVATAGTLHAVVTDMLGRKLMDRELAAQPGRNRFALPAADWAKGTYMIMVTDQQGITTNAQKIVVR